MHLKRPEFTLGVEKSICWLIVTRAIWRPIRLEIL